MRRRFQRLRSEDDGISLVELLVAVGLATVIGGLLVTTVVQSFAAERRTVSRVEALNEAKSAMERMSRDVRAAAPIVIAEAGRVQADVERDVGALRMTYQVVADGATSRIDVTTDDGTSATTRVLVDGLDPATQVFEYLDGSGVATTLVDDIRSVRLRLRVLPSATDASVELDDEVTVRNAREIEEG